MKINFEKFETMFCIFVVVIVVLLIIIPRLVGG